jgi:predicted glycoside hydrolase/deacetylase ChbG (UPF0249 family)
MCHSENMATIKAMEEGVVNSTAVMVPCPWFPEAAAYAKENPKADVGIHLTLTNEWGKYRWGSVLPKGEVSSLLTCEGYLHGESPDVSKNVKAEEVEKELRAQIERAIAFGINPTHLDSHMGSLFWDRADLFEVYLKLGREYKLPILLNEKFFGYMIPGEDHSAKFKKHLNDKDLVITDKVMMDPGMKTREELFSFYNEQLSSLVPGLNVMLMHLGFNDEELNGITARAKNRQWDLEYFTSDECREILKDNDIKLVTWRDVGKVME